MSTQTFVIALAVAAAVLALWVEVRYPRLAPTALLLVFAHVVAAVALLHVSSALTQAATEARALQFGAVFAVVLPALTYVFLSALWLLRVMQGALGGSVRP